MWYFLISIWSWVDLLIFSVLPWLCLVVSNSVLLWTLNVSIRQAQHRPGLCTHRWLQWSGKASVVHAGDIVHCLHGFHSSQLAYVLCYGCRFLPLHGRISGLLPTIQSHQLLVRNRYGVVAKPTVP